MKMLSKAQREVLEKMADGYVLYVVRHYRPDHVARYLHKDGSAPGIRGIRGATLHQLRLRGFIESLSRDPIYGHSWQITDAGRKEVKASKPD